jgi:hypothetical protein
VLDLANVLTLHRSVIDRFGKQLEQMPDSSAPVPHLDWNVAEVGVHVLSVLRAYARAVRDDVPIWDDHRNGATGNQTLIESSAERDIGDIVSAMSDAVDQLHLAWLDHDGDVPVWGPIRVDPATLAAIHTGDVTVHGWDLSRIRGQWQIERAEALAALNAIFNVAPHFVDEQAAQNFTATYGIKLRGGGDWAAAFDDGSLRVRPERPVRADCRLNNDPVSFLLLVFNRVPLWRPALTGKTASYGRRPWLAFKFANLLDSP